MKKIMINFTSRFIISFVLPSFIMLGSSTAPVFAAPAHDHVAMIAMNLTWDTVATQSGQWSDAATWSTGRIPHDGANVHIPQDITVLIRARETANLARVFVEGQLKFNERVNTGLIFDTLLIGATGEVSVGTNARPLSAGVTAELLIKSNNNSPLDVANQTRGILGSGKFFTNGQDRVNMAALAGDALAGTSQITFQAAPAGWAVGDEIVVTATYYRGYKAARRGQPLIDPPLENEVRTITAIDGNNFTLNAPLIYNHKRPNPSLDIYVSNLTRPISIRSASASPLTERGHVMFMEGSQVDIKDTKFKNLGRTDKTKDISSSNPKGVYSLHFHRNYYSQIQYVSNSVIQGTPGWGLVNHSSYMIATNNVVHDFAGSAFVTEASDEIGSFIGNIATGGTNRPSGGKVDAREAVTPEQQIRLRAGDMGKFANGFWMSSPQVVVQNNVVAGSQGTAYFQFPLGTFENDYLTGFPLDRFPAGAIPRTWNYPNQFNGATMGVTADLPLNDFRDNIAYAVFQGFRMRWANDSANFLYGSKTGQDVRQFQTVPRRLTRLHSVIRNLTFWNVASGFNSGYSDNFDLDNITVINEKGYVPQCDLSRCVIQGISINDGSRGVKTKISNSRVENINPAIEIVETITTSNTYVNGELYTQQ